MSFHRLIQFSLLVFVLLIPKFVSAETISFDPKIWSKNVEIVINGNDLKGQYQVIPRLCYSTEVLPDKYTCFGHYDNDKKLWVNSDDPFLKKWVDNQIIFTVPDSTPPHGLLTLFRTNDQQECFGSAGCIDIPKEKGLQIGSFVTRPYIVSILDVSTGSPATSLQKGSIYEIHGGLFGDEKGNLQIGQNQIAASGKSYAVWSKLPASDITRWDYNLVRFSPSQNIDFSLGIKVHNTANESDPFISITTASSSSSKSSINNSSSSANAVMQLFPDVSSTADYSDALAWAKEAGVVSGYADGTFQPDKSVNRAEYLKMVSVAAKSETTTEGTLGFSDVNDKAWYAPFVRTAKMRGIIKGYPDGTFKAEQTVSFAEGLKMGYLTFGITVSDTGGQWYESYLRDAITHDVLRDNNVNVGIGMSRKDVVWMVWKLYGLK